MNSPVLVLLGDFSDRRDVIGAWLTSTPATPGRLTIFREGKRLYAEWRLRSGVTTKDELSETRVAAGRRYDIRSSASEDHFMVTGGELEIRARGGRIAIAERIGPAPVEQPLVSALRQRNATVEKWPPAPSAGEAAAASATAGRLQTTGASAATDAEGTIATNAAARSAARRTVRKVIAPPSPPRIDLWVYLQPTS